MEPSKDIIRKGDIEREEGKIISEKIIANKGRGNSFLSITKKDQKKEMETLQESKGKNYQSIKGFKFRK